MQFGGVVALQDIDFQLAARELRCLIGPNGAGKSTFFKCLIGALRPTGGQIDFKGEGIVGLLPHQIARKGIGIKMQVPSLFDGLPVKENVRLAVRRLKPAVAARRVDDAMERMGISTIRSKLPGELPHGLRQLVELTVVMASEPDLILLDEPAAGMTHEECQRTVAAIAEVNKTHAVIVVEHDMEFIRDIGGHVTVFHQGRIFREGRLDALVQDPDMKEIYLGKGITS